jgi:hypothetical protein
VVERLLKHSADFTEKSFEKSRIVNQDVTFNRFIQTILVQVLEMFLAEIGQVFPQPL